MKRFSLAKVFGATFLALSLSTLPAIAQDAPATGQTTEQRTEDDGFDWGLLGLLGLIGLAGLAGKNNARSTTDEPTRYRDPNEVGSQTNRY